MPVIFLEGFVGRLFREFGVVIAGAVLISAFVSLTLTPMLNAKLVKKDPTKKSRFYLWSEPFFAGLDSWFRSTITGFLRKRWWSLGILAVSIAAIFVFGLQLKSELSPLEDRDWLRLQITAPEGTSYEVTDKLIDNISDFVSDSIPEKTVCLTVTAPGFAGSGAVNTGFVRLALTESDQRERSQQEIAAYINKHLALFPEGKVFVIQEQSISSGGRGGLPVQYVLQTQNFEKLREKLPLFLEQVGKNPTFQGVDVNLKFNKPELKIEINRDKARIMGVSIADVAQTIQLALSGQRFGYYISNGMQYQVIGQVEREKRDDPRDIRELFVRNNMGEMIQLDNVVTVTEQSSPPQLYHYDRYQSATISAGLADGKTIGDGIEEMDKIAASVLDDSFKTSLTGSSRDYAESSSNIVFAFVLALALIYLLLAAQFESFGKPLIIICTVPMALAGAVFALWYFNQTLNIFSQIGMIMLIGLVTKNGILIIEFYDQLREKGLSVRRALIEASTARMRPILMTSLATMLGALPIALALGAGSESRMGMGIVIIGGLLLSMILTLFVIPAMVLIAFQIKIYLRKKFKKRRAVTFNVPRTAMLFLITLLLLPGKWYAQEVLRVDDVIKMALEKNYSVLISKNEQAIAKVQNNIGAAGMSPSLSVNGSINTANINSYQVFNTGAIQDRAGAVNFGTGASLNLDWTIFDGLRMFAVRKRLNMNEELSAIELKRQMENTIYEVVVAYYDIVRNNQLIRAARQNLVLYEERRKIAQLRMEIGSDSKVDLLLSQSDENRARAGIIQLEIDLLNSRVNLNTLMGRGVDTEFQAEDTIVINFNPALEELKKAASASNSSLLASRQNENIFSQSVREARSANLPFITINGAYVFTRNQSQAGFVFLNRQNGLNAGVSARWLLFNGGRNKKLIEERNLLYLNQRYLTDLTQLQVDGQVYVNYQGFLLNRKIVDMELQNLRDSREVQTISLERYRIGKSGLLETIETQKNLEDAQVRFINALYNTKVAETGLLRVNGSLVK
jgi:outer membrane protein TolC